MTEVQQQEVLAWLASQQSITDQDVANVQAQVVAGEDFKSSLNGLGKVDGETIAQAEAQVLSLPYVNLKEIKIPRDVLSIIPESTAREHMIIAYEQTQEVLKLAMTDPGDRQIVEFVHKKVDLPVEVAIASEEAIKLALAQYQQSLDIELSNLLQNVQNLNISDGDDLAKVAEDLPVVRTTDLILKHAILQKASDIHIEPTEDEVIVRYRIDGILQDVLNLPKGFMAGLIARIKIQSNLKIDEHRLPQDGRFKIQTDDYKVAFRVSILPVFDGEKVVMRLLDESGKGLGLDDIGMRPEVLEVFRRNISKPKGMILVTGPTGSGKTTTLYAAMKELNQPEVNISTVEDPIEYRMPRVNQTQVNPQIGFTFSSGLRALVRQDPDILMVGEIRDEETAALAVNAALTGHLVLSTLHTNSAAGALPRLLDMSVEAFLLASSANAFLAQRLVRKLCEDCREGGELGEVVLRDLSKVADIEHLKEVLEKAGVLKESNLAKLQVYRPGSCEKCKTGYKGRIGIYEIFEFTDSIRDLIAKNEETTAGDLQKAAQVEQNMALMIEDGFLKVAQGMTSVDEVLRVAKE